MATDAWVSIPAIKPTFINNAQYYLTILPKKVSGRGQWQHLAMVKVQVWWNVIRIYHIYAIIVENERKQ